MSTPKSVTKVISNKDGCHVEYTSNTDAANYFMFELSRAALRDVGKFVCKLFKNEYYANFEKRTGNAGKACKYKAISGKNTKYPRVQIGLKTGKSEGFYAFFQEFGTSDGRVKKLSILQNAVKNNVGEIVKIESQYLSGLSGEADKLAQMINEDDYDGDGDN